VNSQISDAVRRGGEKRDQSPSMSLRRRHTDRERSFIDTVFSMFQRQSFPVYPLSRFLVWKKKKRKGRGSHIGWLEKGKRRNLLSTPEAR